MECVERYQIDAAWVVASASVSIGDEYLAMVLALESTITGELFSSHLIEIIGLATLPIVVPFALYIVIYGLVVDDLLDVQVRVLISLIINAINKFVTRPKQETESFFILEKRSNKLFKKQPIFCFVIDYLDFWFNAR